MRKNTISAVVVGASTALTAALLIACGSTTPKDGFSPEDSGEDSSSGTKQTDGGGGGGGITIGDSGGKIPTGKTDGSATPPPVLRDGGCTGLQCSVPLCSNDGGTTISGTIMDPAGANPLYNILAFVPLYPDAGGVEAITGGVTYPSGVTCDSCSYLYTGQPIALATSGTDGTFSIPNAPMGSDIPVIVQVGKWRTHTTVNVTNQCGDNPVGSINLPNAGNPSDPIVSIPEIAVSTGSSDTLECLLIRVGLLSSEYTSGPGGSGHIHLYTGGEKGGAGLGGSSEAMATAPASSTSLWDTAADLEQYDITLLSCEGGETYNAIPANLETYLNNGGRVFASHYHYAWFTDPTESGQKYTPPSDWSNLATWATGSNSTDDSDVGGAIVTTLNVGGAPFAKGAAMQAWLAGVKALGTAMPDGTTPANGANDLAIGTVRFNAKVGPANTDSQAWVTTDMATVDSDSTSYATADPTTYFSFNTPVGAVAPPDGGSPPYCGRAVFSDLHVNGGAGNADQSEFGAQAPGGCSPGSGQLSAQEKALEFMLFDLSSCVTPDTATPLPPIPVVDAGYAPPQ